VGSVCHLKMFTNGLKNSSRSLVAYDA
jgi:hypothetical protein